MSRSFLLGIFVLSLAFRLWFNFGYPHPQNAGTADGSEYLRLAESLRQFFSNHSDLSSLSGFKQSGPIFPLFILFCQQSGGLFANLPDWVSPVIGQCVLASVADVFLCLLAHLLWGWQTALACAAFTIFYPAYLINSGRLYAESFSTSISIIILYVICRGFVGERRHGTQLLALGMILAALQLARSVMISLSFVALPITFFQERKSGPVKKLVLLLLGMALVMVPWLLAQKAILNKTSLVVDRVGNYNLFVGTNPDISGWLSYPYPDGTGIENRSAISILKSNVKRSPSRFAKLLLDKPYRLAKFPWNDFRTEFGVYTYRLQVLFHQLLLLLCAVGICLALVRNDDGESSPAGIFRARLFLLAYFASHAIYWLFITVPRYNMTATPVLILFASAGLAALFSLCRRNAAKGVVLLSAFLVFFLAARVSDIGLVYWFTGNPVSALTVLCFLKALCAFLFFFVLWKLFARRGQEHVLERCIQVGLCMLSIILVACPARANGRAFEWQTSLRQKGDKIVQKISLQKNDIDSLHSGQLYLLIDTDGAKGFVENGRVTVNGEILQGPVIPGIALTQDFSAEKQMGNGQIYFECEWIYDCMTAASGLASSEIRQWFVMAVPPKAVHGILTDGAVIVEVENAKGVKPFKIFGTYLPHSLLPSINSSSWEKAFYGVENDCGFTDSRYDAKTDLKGHRSASLTSSARIDDADLSTSAGLQNGSFNLVLTGCRSLPSQQVLTLSASLPAKISLPGGSIKSFCAKISSSLPHTASELWLFRLRGRSWAPKNKVTVEPKLQVMVEDDSGKVLSYPCRWMPRMLPNEVSPAAFDYCFPMMPSLLKEKISSVELTLRRTDNDTDPESLLEIEDFFLEILPIPANPIASQNSIY